MLASLLARLPWRWQLVLLQRSGWSVLVPDGRDVRVDDVCVSCVHPEPDQVWVVQHRRGWAPTLLWWTRKVDRVEMPICSACRSGWRRVRRRVRLVDVLVFIVILTGMAWIGSNLRGPGRIFVLCGVVWGTFVAMGMVRGRTGTCPFDLDRDEGMREFVFRRADVAVAFAALNDRPVPRLLEDPELVAAFSPEPAWRDRGVRSLAERVAEFHQRASGLEDQDEPATDPHEREDEHYAQEKGHTA